ncbi:MAG TPA: hypothetical protein VMC09_07085 [Anaerolineales bacterium]|nr:hypothetical protein [Anaerolineales bacterium]
MNRLSGKGLRILVVVFCMSISAACLAGPTRSSSTPSMPGVNIKTPVPSLTSTLPATQMPTSLPLAWARLNSGESLPRDVITAIVYDPTDPRIIYVGAENSGVYRSHDDGETWETASTGLESLAVDSLVIDPKNPQTLYAGVLNAGVYKSTDGAMTWQASSDGIPGLGIDATEYRPVAVVTLSQQDPSTLYYYEGYGAAYRSTDGGRSWNALMQACPAMIDSLEVSPGNSSVLFSGSNSAEGCATGIYKSSDAGKTWALVLPVAQWAAFGRNIYISQDGRYIYARVNSNDLYRSSDGGATWKRLSMGVSNANVYAACAVSLQDGRTLLCVGQYGGLFRSQDAGNSWHSIIRESDWISAIAYRPGVAGTLLVGRMKAYGNPEDGSNGLYRTSDGGLTWKTENLGLGATRTELFKNPPDGVNLFLEESRRDWWGSWNELTQLFFSPDNGRTLKRIDRAGAGAAIAADGQTVFRFTLGGNSLKRILDRGGSSDTVKLPTAAGASSGVNVFAHPTLPGTIYAAFMNWDNHEVSLFVSRNGGLAWNQSLPPHFMSFDGTTSLIFGPDQNLYFLIHNGQLFRSEDDGVSWLECNLPVSTADSLAVNPRNPHHIYLGSRGQGVFVSQDGGRSWASPNAGLGNLYIDSLASDSAQPDTVFAGTDGGAYISLDDAVTWQAINDGLPSLSVVYSIVTDVQGNAFASTASGIYQLTQK